MTNKKSTRRALLMSLTAMLLCFTMMLGTTFAWFTDSVSSARNTIQSGNLDAILEYSTLNTDGSWTEYDTVDDSTAVFNKNALYEPGYTEVVKFRVTNKGSLAFKYSLKAVVYSETPGENIDNIPFELSDYLYVGTADASVSDRTTAASAASRTLGSGFTMKNDVNLLKGESEEFVFVLTMPANVSNEANHNGTQPKIELGISLFATQYVHESDSFDKNYDEDAQYDDGTAKPGTSGTNTVTVTAADLSSVDFTQDNVTFKLSGMFSDSLTLNVASGLSQTYDASGATFVGGASVVVNAPGVAHSYSALNTERSGNITVTGFTVDALNVLAYNNESVTIKGNTVKAISVIGGNFALDIDSNTVNGDFKKYADGENVDNEYGISLRITDYELSLTDNTVTDTYSHSIAINGRMDEIGDNWSDADTANKITAFSGNKITVNSTQKTNRAALKIWSDPVYASSATLSDSAKELIATILADTTNEFYLEDEKGHTIFDMFGYKTSDGQ